MWLYVVEWDGEARRWGLGCEDAARPFVFERLGSFLYVLEVTAGVLYA